MSWASHEAGLGLSVQRKEDADESDDEVQETEPAPPARSPFEAQFNGDFGAATTAVGMLWQGVGGVVTRQLNAVSDFDAAAKEEDPPSLAESILVGALETALNMALGGVGSAITNKLGGTIKAAAVAGIGAIQGTSPGTGTPTATSSGAAKTKGKSSGKGKGKAKRKSAAKATTKAKPADPAKTQTVPSSPGATQDESSGVVLAGLVAVAAKLATKYVDQTVDAGKSKAQSYIKGEVRGKLEPGTPLGQFTKSQRDALEKVAIEQGQSMVRLLANAPQDTRWVVVQGLHDALTTSLNAAYDVQINSMTDMWFTSQVKRTGGGARPGQLSVKLEDVYGDHKGRLKIKGGNLLGSGSNEKVRSWIAKRPLVEVSIPKVITMNGSLGRGWRDHVFHLHIDGEDQHITEISGHRWGALWLAAYALGLQDLDTDDDRFNGTNKWAGAQKVWDNIKGSSAGSIDDSGW